jgi:hypothetical protein
MRLTLTALLCAAALASPALAGDRHSHDSGPPPPPPGYDGAPPMDPRWHEDQARAHGEWMERCGRQHGGHDHGGCGYPGAYGYGYPGAYMSYGVPMIMVPVMRNKPCKEEVVEYVEEVAPVRRRVIPRPVVRAVPDKRVRIVPDKRVPVAPTKRIAY